jgi:hypothetical protein
MGLLMARIRKKGLPGTVNWLVLSLDTDGYDGASPRARNVN